MMDTQALSNKRLVAIALFELGGAERAVDTEDLAMRVAQIAPGRFRWKKYPEQINLDAVRVSASDLLKETPPFASGGVRDGWMLTPLAIEWCIRTQGKKTDSASGFGSDGHALLRRTEAFRKFQENRQGEITVHDVRRLLKVDEYTSPRRRKERVQAVTNSVIGDTELGALLSFLRDKYVEEWK